MEQFKSLPIIAVTGKAMAGERKRCIEAGANDYVPKPVESAELFAALRPWLPQEPSQPVPVAEPESARRQPVPEPRRSRRLEVAAASDRPASRTASSRD